MVEKNEKRQTWVVISLLVDLVQLPTVGRNSLDHLQSDSSVVRECLNVTTSQHIESMQTRNSVSLHIPNSAYYFITLRDCDISTYLIILLLIASIDCNRCQSSRSPSVCFQFILLLPYSSSFHFFFSAFQASACHSHSSTG